MTLQQPCAPGEENGILHLRRVLMTLAVVGLEKDNQHTKPHQAMKVRPYDGGHHR